MSGFEPGPGWRRTSPDETEWPRATARIEYFEDGREVCWVRVPPVPPLPTEPYTVIRVTPHVPSRTPGVWTLHEDGRWHAPLGYYRFPEDLADTLTGFEVLAEPRTVTLDAALVRAVDFLDKAWQPGTYRTLSYDLQQALLAAIRDGASS